MPLCVTPFGRRSLFKCKVQILSFSDLPNADCILTHFALVHEVIFVLRSILFHLRHDPAAVGHGTIGELFAPAQEIPQGPLDKLALHDHVTFEHRLNVWYAQRSFAPL